MKRNIITALILSLFIFTTGYTQQAAKPEAKGPAEAAPKVEAVEKAPEGNIYREITIMDFENIEFKDADIIFQKAREEEYKIAMRDETPAPINSKKYLGVKLRGTKSNAIQIKFPKDKIPVIDNYCQSISVWIYGKNFTGEFAIYLMDATGKTFRLSFGKLNFQGWHKLTKIIPSVVAQTNKFLEVKTNIKIMSMVYVPGTGFKPGTTILDPEWQTFYVDDITAKVREKYKDSQNDEW
ncbi:MAG: flagellar filament outer layer protein FlaA [Spirochaetota bacterium]